MCAITLTDVTDECALPGILVARDGGMQITDRHRWLLVATLAGFVASKLATQLASATWMVADGNDPPEDPTDRNFAWMPALVFGRRPERPLGWPTSSPATARVRRGNG